MFFRKKLAQVLSLKTEPRLIVNRILDGASKKKEVEKFTSGEKIFWLIWWVKAEVSNGSFDQYITNSTGDDFAEARAAFETIGLPRVVAIFDQLAAIFPGDSVPKDRAERCEAWWAANVDETWIRALSTQFREEYSSEAMLEFARSAPGQFAESY